MGQSETWLTWLRDTRPWEWAFEGIGVVVLSAVVAMLGRWFLRRRRSPQPSTSPATQTTITASHGSAVGAGSVTTGDNATITISGGATADDNKLAEQLAEYRQREQFYQDQIRTLNYMRSVPDLFNAQQEVPFDSPTPQSADYDAEAASLEEDFNQVEQLLTLGIDLARQGDYRGAIDNLDQAINLQPEYALAYYNRGVTRARQGRYDKAIADFEHVIRLKPYDDLAYLYRGLAHAWQHNYDAAIKDYNRASQLQPGRGRTYHCRGSAHLAQGDYPKAIDDYDRAIDFILSPYNARSHNNRGIARAMQGDDHDGAMADFNKAIELQPDYDAAYLNRGHGRVAQGDYAGAIDDYKHYLELGGGARCGNQEEVEQRIRALQAQLDGR